MGLGGLAPFRLWAVAVAGLRGAGPACRRAHPPALQPLPAPSQHAGALQRLHGWGAETLRLSPGPWQPPTTLQHVFGSAATHGQGPRLCLMVVGLAARADVAGSAPRRRRRAALPFGQPEAVDPCLSPNPLPGRFWGISCTVDGPRRCPAAGRVAPAAASGSAAIAACSVPGCPRQVGRPQGARRSGWQASRAGLLLIDIDCEPGAPTSPPAGPVVQRPCCRPPPSAARLWVLGAHAGCSHRAVRSPTVQVRLWCMGQAKMSEPKMSEPKMSPTWAPCAASAGHCRRAVVAHAAAFMPDRCILAL